MLPQISMQYSLKVAFWERLMQAQYLQQYDGWNIAALEDEFNEYGWQTDQCFELFPEMAREKFFQSGAFFCSGDIVAALNAAFQALQICSFTLGSNHPALTIIMQHIATICDSQGLKLEAERMREDALAIVTNDQGIVSQQAQYLH